MNMKNAFRLVNPVSDRTVFIFKVIVFINGLNINRIPYLFFAPHFSR